MVPVGQIFGPFVPPNRTKVGQYMSFRLFFYFSNFDWIHMKLDLQARWRNFRRCVKDRSQRPQFLGHFGPSNGSKFRYSTILLKSFFWIHTSLALYARCSYCQRCVQYEPQRPNFWAILDPKVSQNSGLVSHQYCFTCSLQVVSAVCGIWASEAQFLGPLWAPK